MRIRWGPCTSLPLMGLRSFRIQRNSLEYFGIFWTAVWRWMWRNGVLGRSYCSIHSWSWLSPCPVWRRWFWQPRMQWKTIASSSPTTPLGPPKIGIKYYILHWNAGATARSHSGPTRAVHQTTHTARLMLLFSFQSKKSLFLPSTFQYLNFWLKDRLAASPVEPGFFPACSLLCQLLSPLDIMYCFGWVGLRDILLNAFFFVYYVSQWRFALEFGRVV